MFILFLVIYHNSLMKSCLVWFWFQLPLAYPFFFVQPSVVSIHSFMKSCLFVWFCLVFSYQLSLWNHVFFGLFVYFLFQSSFHSLIKPFLVLSLVLTQLLVNIGHTFIESCFILLCFVQILGVTCHSFIKSRLVLFCLGCLSFMCQLSFPHKVSSGPHEDEKMQFSLNSFLFLNLFDQTTWLEIRKNAEGVQRPQGSRKRCYLLT